MDELDRAPQFAQSPAPLSSLAEAGRIDLADPHRPGLRGEEAGECLARRRLPRPGFADDAVRRPAGDGEGDVLDADDRGGFGGRGSGGRVVGTRVDLREALDRDEPAAASAP